MHLRFELSMRDMLFANYAVETPILQKLLPAGFTLSRPPGCDPAIGFLSLVAFRVVGFRVNDVKLPFVSYCQLNCRIYVEVEGEMAVYFLLMRSSSRLGVFGANLLGVPVQFGSVEVSSTEVTQKIGEQDVIARSNTQLPRLLHISSTGVNLVSSVSSEIATNSEFFTERPVGYIRGRRGVIGVTALHQPLTTFAATPERVSSPILNDAGLSEREESLKPKSMFYVPDAILRSNVQGVFSN